MERYRESGARVVVDEFLQSRWPGYREPLERVLPGAFEQALANAATTFTVDVPAALDSRFGEADARGITQPVLVVLGEGSVALHPRFAETYRLLLDWLPDAEGFVLPRATHFLQVENPRDMAVALADFYERHPLEYCVRAAEDDDREWVVAAAREVLGSEYQVYLHRQFVVTDADVLIAELGGERVGFLSWEIAGDTCETLAIACTRRGRGAGTALMESLHRLAAERGCARLKVVTTDENLGAQRFYERLGYEVAEIRAGAVDECRRLYKPELPPDMHDEIEYARPVAGERA